MAVTRTVGGVICGYCAIGSSSAAMAPSSTITIEMTHARTGRSMKKRASMITSGPSFHQLRLHGHTGTHLLQSIDDHALVGSQAADDLPQAVVQHAELDRA